MVEGYGEKLIKSPYTYTKTRAFTDLNNITTNTKTFRKYCTSNPNIQVQFPVLICNIGNIKTLCVIIFPSLIFILLPVKPMYYF